ncbi:MAG TPA: serine/threonine-protein kinase [Streptosporangiaceae bacterium]|nr:serine/threonine-protein kinase [Streptosporangiaceae bacterium]
MGGDLMAREWDVAGYTEVKALGSGGFGDVVLARHDGSGTAVAIKYLRRQLLADPGFAAAFRAEAAVLASLDDPNVVRLYEYVESPGGAAIVMELVDGVSLRDILVRRGKTTAEAALVVLQGSLLGLAAAHRRGVVHRDYKPENVLIDGAGASKLTDFGIAARAGDSPVPAGTLVYAPPEQFGGSPATPASDVYAATATFYECLTGRPPFTGDTAERLLYQHLSQPVPLEPVPGPLRALVAAGLAKDPADRPADGTALVGELRAVAGDAYGPGWEDRGRSGLAAAALLLAALWPSGGPAAVQGSAVHRVRLRRRLPHGHIGAAKAAVTAGVVIVGVAVAAAVVLPRPTGHPAPPPAPAPAPALVYTTSTSVDLRAGSGSVRTLATFPKDAGFTGPQAQLAWSADGSKVAWLDSQGVGEFIVGRDQVRTWRCHCSSIVFRGDQLLSDDYTAENAPRLLSYPDDGSAPVPIVISGLPPSRFPTDNAYSLVAAVPPADVIVGYGMGVSGSGGPQLLYRVDAEGRAVPFTPVAPQITGNTAPGRFVLSPDGARAGFLLGELAGVCADDDTAVLADVATGAQTQPAMPAGMRHVLAVWFGPSGTVYASMAPDPPGCAHVGQGTVASVVVPAQDYRLAAGTWVRSGSGVIDEESVRGGGEATLYGAVDTTPLGAFASTGLRLVVSRGSSSTTIPGALTFMWAPAAAPASSPAPSAVSSPVSSPALPTRRQAAQALAALLAQSGTDRAAVTQAVNAVAACSPGLSQDETTFSTAASSRQVLLGKLAALPDRAALPASMLQDLTTAWQASGQADQDFAGWTQDEISRGCTTNYQSDASYQAAMVPDGQATKDKKAFAAAWKAIANEYGLPVYRYNQI